MASTLSVPRRPVRHSPAAEAGGYVFDIQKFSLHDGPGIRDLVFLKGCPLRCQWCANPESQRPHPETLFRPDRCLGFEICGLCEPACPEQAIGRGDGGEAVIDRTACTHCGECAKRCPTGAIEQSGRHMTAAEVLAIVVEDAEFHFRSGGGMTVSGGEPLVQADFTAALLEGCRRRLIHTAVETSGHGPWSDLEKMARHADLILYDIKCMDPDSHRAVTGISNEIILRNLRRLSDRFPDTPVTVRTPVIPGVNDSAAEIQEIARFVKGIETVNAYRLLPFHRLGLAKYTGLGRSCTFAETAPLDDERMDALKAIAAREMEMVAA